MVILDGEEYLTGEEAAAVLGIKRETLYAYVSRGFLKSYRQGIKRQRLYRQTEVASLIQLAPTSGDQAPERSVARGATRGVLDQGLVRLEPSSRSSRTREPGSSSPHRCRAKRAPFPWRSGIDARRPPPGSSC
jgi:excisionase family DNA binding protein